MDISHKKDNAAKKYGINIHKMFSRKLNFYHFPALRPGEEIIFSLLTVKY